MHLHFGRPGGLFAAIFSVHFTALRPDSYRLRSGYGSVYRKGFPRRSLTRTTLLIEFNYTA